MAFELPELPYALNALEPYLSKETLEYHYGKHHKAYVDNLNKLIPNTEFADMSLESIIKKSANNKAAVGVFNNAAQVWNHTFYWHCMRPKAGGTPKGEIAQAIKENFGSFEEFKEKFSKAAVGQFGSGWAWLAKTTDGKLEIFGTGNADTPMTHNKHALLTCDVWEHAYYIDYRNARPKYVENFWNLINWDFVTRNFDGA